MRSGTRRCAGPEPPRITGRSERTECASPRSRMGGASAASPSLSAAAGPLVRLPAGGGRPGRSDRQPASPRRRTQPAAWRAAGCGCSTAAGMDKDAEVASRPRKATTRMGCGRLRPATCRDSRPGPRWSSRHRYLSGYPPAPRMAAGRRPETTNGKPAAPNRPENRAPWQRNSRRPTHQYRVIRREHFRLRTGIFARSRSGIVTRNNRSSAA